MRGWRAVLLVAELGFAISVAIFAVSGVLVILWVAGLLSLEAHLRSIAFLQIGCLVTAAACYVLGRRAAGEIAYRKITEAGQYRLYSRK